MKTGEAFFLLARPMVIDVEGATEVKSLGRLCRKGRVRVRDDKRKNILQTR